VQQRFSDREHSNTKPVEVSFSWRCEASR